MSNSPISFSNVRAKLEGADLVIRVRLFDIYNEFPDQWSSSLDDTAQQFVDALNDQDEDNRSHLSLALEAAKDDVAYAANGPQFPHFPWAAVQGLAWAVFEAVAVFTMFIAAILTIRTYFGI